jgi:hypothetical protein
MRPAEDRALVAGPLEVLNCNADPLAGGQGDPAIHFTRLGAPVIDDLDAIDHTRTPSSVSAKKVYSPLNSGST